MMSPERNLSYYLNKEKKLQDIHHNTSIRAAFLSSFTINGLAETIRVKCAEEKINCFTYVGPYNQYAQEILNSQSNLYQFNPMVTFLIVDVRSVLGNIFYSPYLTSESDRRKFLSKQLNELLNLVKLFIKNSNSKLVISNLAIPSYSPFGICETKTEYNLRDMVIEFNNGLSTSLLHEPSVYVYDFNAFITKYGEDNIFNLRQFLTGDIRISLQYIPYLSNDLMGFIKPLLGKNRKCIVLDLDNTLWGGIVGEDGFDGITLGSTVPGNAYLEFQRYLLSLHQRGIILAINSKNNQKDALEVIKKHPSMILREEHFACFKINWDDKVSNMREISEELNIGLDSMVFFDDDYFNRELMKKSLPEVLTIDLPEDPALFSYTLKNLNDFNVLKITDEDLSRGKMYVQQRSRKEIEKNVTNLEDFLKELDVKVHVKKVDGFTIPRISQLTLKTNQFNLTTKRYQEEDIRKFTQDKNIFIGCAQVEDKFGDNGITGAFIIKKNNSHEWYIDTFLLSCRIMGRQVENAIMTHILNQAKKEGVTQVKGQYIPTEKNMPCSNFLAQYGFIKEGEYWIFSLDNKIKMPLNITLSEE